MKVRFVLEMLEDKLVIKNVKRADLCVKLEKGGYLKYSQLTKIKSTKLQEKLGVIKIDEKPEENAEEEEPEGEEQKRIVSKAKEYDYLLNMNLWSLTYERVEELKRQHRDKTNEMKVLEATSDKDMWREDIKEFLKELELTEKIELEEMLKIEKIKGGGKDKSKKQRRKLVKKNFSSDSEAEEKSKKKKKPKKEKEGDEEEDEKMITDKEPEEKSEKKKKGSRSKKSSEESTGEGKSRKGKKSQQPSSDEVILEEPAVEESNKG